MEECEEARPGRSRKSGFIGVSRFTDTFLATFCVREGRQRGEGDCLLSKEQIRGGKQKVRIMTVYVGGRRRGGRMRGKAGMENVWTWARGRCRGGENQ